MFCVSEGSLVVSDGVGVGVLGRVIGDLGGCHVCNDDASSRRRMLLTRGTEEIQVKKSTTWKSEDGV